eukprot:Tamp_28883.p1 GENE.Tamp_28883~~Tamp_28883.p1  ORF type:complete len:158 (-),score=0.33 Tamp_28883:26-499(-)
MGTGSAGARESIIMSAQSVGKNNVTGRPSIWGPAARSSRGPHHRDRTCGIVLPHILWCCAWTVQRPCPHFAYLKRVHDFCRLVSAENGCLQLSTIILRLECYRAQLWRSTRAGPHPRALPSLAVGTAAHARAGRREEHAALHSAARRPCSDRRRRPA